MARRMLAVVVVSLATACSGSDTGAGGAGTTGAASGGTTATGQTTTGQTSSASSTSTGTSGAFPCAGTPLPTTAPAMVKLAGVSQTTGISGTQKVGNVTIQLFEGASQTPTATTTSDAMGAYSFTIATSGVPVDGYAHGSAPTYLDTYLYPPAPLAADVANATMLLITPGTLDLVGTFASVTQAAGNGFMGVVVSDCSGMPVAGATVTTTPSGTVRYNQAGIPSNTAMVTDADGVAYVFNVPAGTVTVGASAQGTTFRAHDVLVRADVLTTTVVAP